jgi:hypothetical protein
LVPVGMLTVLAAACERRAAPSAEDVFAAYIDAANRHDLEAVRDMLAEDATWHLGSDTLVGLDAVMRPLEFDQGANTVLAVTDVSTTGDTIASDIIERNDVLTALGVPVLHHKARMVLKDGLIYRISPREPPLEVAAFADSVITFMQWLRTNQPEAYEQLWPGGRFNYSRQVGEEMPGLIDEWRRNR